MTDDRSSHDDRKLGIGSELRTSLAPTALETTPVVPDRQRAQRSKLAFACATGLFWGAAMMLMVDGAARPEARPAAAAPAPRGIVEIGEIQVLNSPGSPALECGELGAGVRPAVAKLCVSPPTVAAPPLDRDVP
jgi:hypothetical protein